MKIIQNFSELFAEDPPAWGTATTTATSAFQSKNTYITSLTYVPDRHETDPDPALFGSGFQDANTKYFVFL
jgi:hypothetical protein